MSDQLKQPQSKQNNQSKPVAQKEEQKANEKQRPQTTQGSRDNYQGDRKKNYNNKTKDTAPTKESLLGQELKKPRRDNDYEVRRPRVEKEDFYKLEITLETEIPELPPKNKKIQKPDDETHLKEVQKIGDQIDENYDKIQKFIEDLRVQVRKNNSQGKTNQDPIRDLVKTKNEEKKQLYETFNEVKKKYDAAKEKLEEATNQAATYKQKMKTTMSKDELQKELNYLQDQQKHGNISIQEEKVIIKKIAELQKSLPYAEPLQALTVEIKALKADRDVLLKQVKTQGDKIQVLKAEIQESYDTLNSFKAEKDKLFVDFQPMIEAKKNEILPIIEKLKQDKKDKKEAHYKQWQDYEAQEQLVKKIEYIKKRKAQLQRKQLEELETQAAQDKLKAELALISENPYKDEINLCNLLSEYCQKLLPGSQTQQQQVVQEKNNVADVLKTDAWKKEKVTEIGFRRDEELNEFAVSSTNKKNKNKNNQQKPAQQQSADQPKEVLLNHKYEVLQYFEQLSLAAPLLQKQLENTIQLLAQKKKYYEELPTDDVTGYLKPSQKEEEEEQKSHKKDKKQKKHQDVFNVVDEEFPDMK